MLITINNFTFTFCDDFIRILCVYSVFAHIHPQFLLHLPLTPLQICVPLPPSCPLSLSVNRARFAQFISTWVRDHPREHGQPPSGHSLKGKWLSLPRWQPTANSSSARRGAARAPPPPVVGFWLLDLVQIATAVESSRVPQPYPLQRTALQSTPPHLTARVFFLSPLLWCPLSLWRKEGWRKYPI